MVGSVDHAGTGTVSVVHAGAAAASSIEALNWSMCVFLMTVTFGVRVSVNEYADRPLLALSALTAVLNWFQWAALISVLFATIVGSGVHVVTFVGQGLPMFSPYAYLALPVYPGI
jgi:hypothetical protein